MNNLFDRQCIVYRLSDTLDATYNRPIVTSSVIGQYYCCISGKTGSESIANPQMQVTTNFKIYMGYSCDVQEGDIIEVDSCKYIVENVYRPRKHHTQCNVTIQKEN